MIDFCFVTVNPLIMVGMSIVLLLAVLYITFMTYRKELTAFFLTLLFSGGVFGGLLFITCWAFLVALIELVLILYLRKKKIEIVQLD